MKGVLLTTASIQRLKDKLRRRPETIIPNPRNPLFINDLDIKIFEVQTVGTGEGIYDCFELQLVEANWAGTGQDKFQPKGEPDEDGLYETVEILNLAESGGEANALEVEDRMACWQRTDDEGKRRWVGLSLEPAAGIRTAFVAEDAPASDHITCLLDYDGTDPETWSLKAWAKDKIITGSDSKIYRCTTAYAPVDDTTKPASGADWEDHWALVTEIEVYCRIAGGGNLDKAYPHLLTMQKSIGYDSTVPAEWTAKSYSEGDYCVGTNSKEYYQCILAHTGTINNRPSSGATWETDWELAKLFACELRVVKEKGVWKAVGLFQTNFEDMPLAP